jgi:hypothetical protein
MEFSSDVVELVKLFTRQDVLRFTFVTAGITNDFGRRWGTLWDVVVFVSRAIVNVNGNGSLECILSKMLDTN